MDTNTLLQSITRITRERDKASLRKVLVRTLHDSLDVKGLVLLSVIRDTKDYLEESVESKPGSDALLEDQIAAEQKVKLYCDAIAELPPQCRRVFLLRKVQALSHRAIAQELGITPSAVEKQIALGAERCKKYIERRESLHSRETETNYSHQKRGPQGK